MGTMTFNGIDMSRYLRIIDVDGGVGNERTISADTAPLIGENIQSVAVGPKILKVTFALTTQSAVDMETLKHKLAGIFYTNQPVRIDFSTEPDKYYMGMVRGEVSLSKITNWFRKGELELYIPDGVAHSNSYKRITSDAATISRNKAVFTIQNNGNAPAIPIVTVKHADDNGYLGLVNQTAAFEVGDIEEADGYTKQLSKMLLDYKHNGNITHGLRDAQKNVAVLNDTSQRLEGTVSQTDMWGRPHLVLSQSGGTTGNNGGSLTWTFPPDTNGDAGSLNDYVWWRQIFWAGAINQYGFMKVMVSDASGKFLYGVETFKRSNGLGCEYNFLARNTRGGYDVLKRWTFQGTHEDKDNPFNQNRGFCDMLRRNDVVQVYFWGEYKKFNIAAIKNVKGAKLHVSFGSMGNKPLVSHMYLDEIYYRKDFVTTFYELPNTFMPGSSATINAETDTVYVDGILANYLAVDGSKWLTIPPGKSTLEVYWSSWAQPPNITINFEERWL